MGVELQTPILTPHKERLYHSTNSSTPAPYMNDTDTSTSDSHIRVRILKHPYSRVFTCSTHNSNKDLLATNSRLASPTNVLMQVSPYFHSSLPIHPISEMATFRHTAIRAQNVMFQHLFLHYFTFLTFSL